MANEKQKTLQAQVLEALSNENAEHASVFAAYMQRLLITIDKKTGKPKNAFMQTKSASALAELFRRVKGEGLVFDGKHITLTSRGISYDYVAYKNKMLLVYPETMLDMSEVKEGDTFTASKENGKVMYSHKIGDPMQTADFKTINGAYCIIKNKRGEFLTTLSKEDIAKHRKVAETDNIWSQWFKEMVLKTVIKKATKYHFDDIFEGMNEEDNKNIDLDNMIYVPDGEVDHAKVAEVIKKIEGFKNITALKAFYLALSPEFIRNGDVHEAYDAQKSACIK